MSLGIDPRAAALKDIDALKRHLRSKGYTTKVVFDDKTMERASALVTGDKRYKLTPPDELRYMEGLLDLPMGYMEEFGIIPAEGYEVCGCGRTPSALDVVLTALKQGIHGKALVRETILGLENVFEIADAGRDAGCVSCGKLVRVARYHYKRTYMYA
jgi:hypothetical protein